MSLERLFYFTLITTFLNIACLESNENKIN